MSCGAMRVADVMRTDVPTITPDTTLDDILQIAWHRGVRHLLVVEGAALVGIVSDRDLKRALTGDASIGRGRTTAADIMTRTMITVGPHTTVKSACDTMMQEAISALPVVEGGTLKGMLTETDVLALFAKIG